MQEGPMDAQLQVITIPVGDVDRALDFYTRLAGFADPDGNTWVLQEIGYQWPDPATSKEPR